MEETPFKGLVV